MTGLLYVSRIRPAIIPARLSWQDSTATLRDLLVAATSSLRLLEFYRYADGTIPDAGGRLPPEFLFGAISLLTDLDGKIRQSSNQRLLVELGLMKIAGLGQKKITPSIP